MRIYKAIISAVKNGQVLRTVDNMGCIMGEAGERNKTRKGAIENSKTVLKEECVFCGYEDYEIQVDSVKTVIV